MTNTTSNSTPNEAVGEEERLRVRIKLADRMAKEYGEMSARKMESPDGWKAFNDAWLDYYTLMTQEKMPASSVDTYEEPCAAYTDAEQEIVDSRSNEIEIRLRALEDWREHSIQKRVEMKKNILRLTNDQRSIAEQLTTVRRDIDALKESEEELRKRTRQAHGALEQNKIVFEEWANKVNKGFELLEANHVGNDNAIEAILIGLGVDVTQFGDPPTMGREQIIDAVKAALEQPSAPVVTSETVDYIWDKMNSEEQGPISRFDIRAILELAAQESEAKS